MSIYETLILDGLDLNGAVGLRGKELEWKPARKILEYVKSADSDGVKLVRRPKHEMAQLTYKLRVVEQANMDDALDLLQAIVDKLQAAVRVSASGGRGIELLVGPANSTRTGTVYVQAGEVEDLPRDHVDGWFRRRPTVTIRLDCHPFIYSDEVVSPAVPTTDSTPLHLLEVPDVGGDVEAEARLIFTDMAGQPRRFIAWGLENDGYDPATALLIDSDSLLTANTAGAQATRTGAYDPNASGNNVIRATLTTTPVAVAKTPVLSLVGTFRVFARGYASGPGVRPRLAYRSGRNPWSTNSYATPPAEDALVEVDLGIVTSPVAAAGSQGLECRVEGLTDAAGDTFDVDYLIFIPAGDVGGGIARSAFTIETPTEFVARDEFGQTAGAVVGKAPAAGPGTYTALTGSDATDFDIDATGHRLRRTAVSDTGSFGGGSWIGRAVGLNVNMGATAFGLDYEIDGLTANITVGQMLRVVDNNNFLLVYLARSFSSGAEAWLPRVYKVVGNVATALYVSNSVVLSLPQKRWRLLTYAVGDELSVYINDFAGGYSHVLSLQDADLGTTLATGDIYVFDQNTGSSAAVTRYFDNLAAWVPQVDAACFANQSAEFRAYGDDACLREDDTGTYYGTPGEYRGARFWLPPGTSRVAVMARRADIKTMPAANVTDGGRVQVAYRERRLVLPG